MLFIVFQEIGLFNLFKLESKILPHQEEAGNDSFKENGVFVSSVVQLWILNIKQLLSTS